MRLFVAVVPPDDVIEQFDEFVDVRREAAAFRWTSPEAWHVTLAFCEQVADRSYDELVERLGATAARRTPFEAAIAGGGAFPDVSRGKVLWAGLALSEFARSELDQLAAGARSAAATSGIAVDGTRFRPHVTLARLSVPRELTNWVRLLDAYRGPTWTVDRITLVQSYLGEGARGRPRYEALEEFALCGAS